MVAKKRSRRARREKGTPLRSAALEETSLLARVQAFDAASRAGKYYESFQVNSRNFMEKSSGTLAFIEECHRLLDRCVVESRKGDPAETRDAIEIILALVHRIDEGYDVIFFADEAGSWQIGIDRPKVLRALFACLSRTADPDEYARRVVRVVAEFDRRRAKEHLITARRLATAAQRKALAVVAGEIGTIR